MTNIKLTGFKEDEKLDDKKQKIEKISKEEKLKNEAKKGIFTSFLGLFSEKQKNDKNSQNGKLNLEEVNFFF